MSNTEKELNENKKSEQVSLLYLLARERFPKNGEQTGLLHTKPPIFTDYSKLF